MKIDKTLLDDLTEQAKQSPRLRVSYDLRNTSGDQSQRMLNAIEPGSEIKVHRHSKTSETVVVVRGKVEEVFFDAEGQKVESSILFTPNQQPLQTLMVFIPAFSLIN